MVAGCVAPGFFVSATPVDNVSCVMRCGRNLAQDLTKDFEFSVGVGQTRVVRALGRSREGAGYSSACFVVLSSRLGFFLSEY